MNIKSYTDTEFREKVSRSLTEVNLSLQRLAAKYQSDLPNTVDSTSGIKNVEKKCATSDTNLEIKISGTESDAKFAVLMQHEFRESKKVLAFLGEDENGITNKRRLGKFNKIASRPGPILIYFTKYWAVKKLLAGVFRLKS